MMWFIWLPIFLIIIFAVTEMSKNNKGNNLPKDSPLDILKKRYAKGEITKEQFEEIKNTIS
ncbi:MAG: electron transporter RnfE [Flavobacteriales bacterium CG_4_10_14_0_8_um_filter_32_5]|nr:MAG: electron transporter RnfE [Flavobacteriales bacterium CG_4_10_14_0_8_um_filter_32_5]